MYMYWNSFASACSEYCSFIKLWTPLGRGRPALYKAGCRRCVFIQGATGVGNGGHRFSTPLTLEPTFYEANNKGSLSLSVYSLQEKENTMQLTGRIAFSMCVLISAVATASLSSAKLRRDGVLNLYPFPRVGRAHDTWQVPINDEDFGMELASKRQLYAFPRVGRADYQPNLNRFNFRLEDILLGQPKSHRYVKKEESDGMWFGPRVGRSFSYNDENGRYEGNGRSVPEEAEVERVDREKRQTKQA